METLMEYAVNGMGIAYEPEAEPIPALGRTTKEHTHCFICARTYFYRLLNRCPRCASRVLRHYSSDELRHFHRDHSGSRLLAA
ncbi:MAG: hypothetical protein ACRD1O_04370 [Terriglobia bacterium]